MQADETLVAYIATTYYNLSPVLGSIKPLCGYSDKNFLLTDSSNHKTYVLKIVNKDESIVEVTDIIDEITQNVHAYSCAELPATNLLPRDLTFVVPKLVRTTGDKLSSYTSVRYIKEARPMGDDLESSFETVKCNIKLFEHFDGITVFDYINSAKGLLGHSKSSAATKLRNEQLYRKLGRVCNELFVCLRNQRHLIERLKRARGHSFPWQMTTCVPHLRRLLARLYPDELHAKRLLVERALYEYSQRIKPKLDELPEFILHSDLCSKNILVNRRKANPQFSGKVCLIDFQDLQVGPQVIDLAILMFYSVIEQEQIPFEKALKLIPNWTLAGYQSNDAARCPLEVGELQLVPALMKLRLCQSLLNGQLAFEEDPKNEYVMHTNQRGWQLLELMSDELSDYGQPNKLVSFWLSG